MIPLGSFRGFFLKIFGLFLFVWIAMVVMPWTDLGHLEPLPVAGSDTDIVPWDSPGLAHHGEQVYIAAGCVYCHTQQVRPKTSGADLIRGWGTAKNSTDDSKEPTIERRTYPRDYIWQTTVQLGNSRMGADLSNVGELYNLLYGAQPDEMRSSMPQYRYLFTTQKISGAPSEKALLLSGPVAPDPGYEVVPTAECDALVAYLLSLKKGYHLADENGPVDEPVKKEESP
jgi:cytochrome c oxidase cbb3-type subunit 2